MGKLWKTGPSTLKIPQKTAQVWELAEALGTWQLDQHGAILTCQWDAQSASGPRDFPKILWGWVKNGQPSGYVKIAIENDHRNSGIFPLKMVIFHSYVNVYQRVPILEE